MRLDISSGWIPSLENICSDYQTLTCLSTSLTALLNSNVALRLYHQKNSPLGLPLSCHHQNHIHKGKPWHISLAFITRLEFPTKYVSINNTLLFQQFVLKCPRSPYLKHVLSTKKLDFYIDFFPLHFPLSLVLLLVANNPWACFLCSLPVLNNPLVAKFQRSSPISDVLVSSMIKGPHASINVWTRFS